MSAEAPAARSSVLRSSAVMAAGTMVSRLLGLIRTILLTAVLGGTVAANAFGTANTLPNMIYILLAGGVLNAVLVPQMTRALKQADGGQAYTNKLLTLAMTILLIITIVFTVASPLVYFLMDVSGSTPTALGVAFTFVCLPQIMFYGIYTLLGEALNARGRFGAFMWSPVLANIFAIAGLVWFWLGTTAEDIADPDRWTWKMIAVLAGSATLGIVAQALVLIIPLRRSGYSFTPDFRFRGVGLRTASTVALWAFAAVIVQQLGIVVSMNVLNSVNSGVIYQQNAFLLFMLPHSIVTISLVTALYTRLSHAASDERTDDVKADLDLGLRLSALASVAVTVGSVALVHPLARGLFGDSDGPPTADMTIALMIGLVPFTICALETRVFYAYLDARTPFWTQVVCTLIAIPLIILAVALPSRWVAPGVGLAGSISYFVQSSLGWYLLRRRIGHIPIGNAVRTYARLIAAAAAATLVAMVVRLGLAEIIGDSGRVRNLVLFTAAAVPFLAVYMAVARRLGVSEVDQLLRPVLSRLPGGRAGAAESKSAPQAAPGTSSDTTSHAVPTGPPTEPRTDPRTEPSSEPRAELPSGLPGGRSSEAVPLGAASAPPPGDGQHPAPARAESMWLGGDDDHTMNVPAMPDEFTGWATPVPIRVRLPRVPTVRHDLRATPSTTSSFAPGPDGAPDDGRIPGSAGPNSRMGRGAGPGELAPAVSDGTTTTEGEHSVQGIEAGHKLAGRYLLRQAIASTDLKQVWEATDETLSREVTATIFPADSANAAAALDSARRAAAVEDRHLPRVLDVGTEDDHSYVITESLAGSESIASMVHFEPLPVEEARRLIGEAAAGLHAAAARGLRHLALTPHEIVRGKDGSVYVLGTATESALAGSDDLPPAEASRQDTVGLVRVLYSALTGKWPGEHEVRGVPQAARNSDGDVSPVTSLRRNVPKDLNSLCLAVLGDDAGPRTPGELATLLAPWSSEVVREDAKTEEKPDRTDSLGKWAAAGVAAAGATAAGAARANTDDDETAFIQATSDDPDATHTFDAAALESRRQQRSDEYDPSFSELDPPLPMLNSGHEDPDQDTSKLALAIVAAFLVAALVLGIIGLRGLFSGGSDKGSTPPRGLPSSSASGSSGSASTSQQTPAQQPSGQRVSVASITSFDPLGDGNERNELAGKAIDGNTATVWMSRVYGRADYQGGRKNGAGLILDLGKSTQVGTVNITTGRSPSTIEVYVTDQSSIVGKKPFGVMADQSGEASVTASAPARGRYVILWVTKLAAAQYGGYRERIAEVEVLS